MATASQTSFGINMIMSSAIKSTNFLQASVKGVHKFAKGIENVNLLNKTKFPLLNRNMKQLQGHLGHIRKVSAQIANNPIKLDIKTSRNSLKEARKDMTALQQEAKQYAFFTRKANENLNKPIRQQKRRANTKIGGTSVVGAIATGASIFLPFKASIQFESSMARVRALSNATDKDFKALNQTALYLGKTTEWSASQVASGMQFLSMAGFNAKQTISAMPGLLSLATAGATDLATTSDIASNIMGGFGIDPTDTVQGMSAMNYVSDVLAKTITSANVDMRMLGETMKYVAPVAKTAGMNLQETSAMAGLLGNIGIQGSMAGTTLKSMLLRLASPTGGARKALDSLNISALDANGNIKNMPLLLTEVAKATEKMGSGTRLGFIKKVFGTEPAAGINKLIEQSGSGALKKYLGIVNQFKGSSQKIASIQLDTTAGQFKLFGSALEGLSISATTSLLPTIRLITNGLTSVTGSIESFSTKYPNASKWVFGLGAAFVVGSVALAGFGLVASGVGTAIGLISLPVVAVVAGVTALAGAVVYLYNRFESVRQVFSSFIGGVTSSLSPMVQEFKSSFSGIGQSVSIIYSSIKPVVSWIWNLMGGMNTVKTIASGLGTVIGFAFKMALTPIKWVFQSIEFGVGLISTFILKIQSVSTSLVTSWGNLKKKASFVWTGITNAIKAPFVTLFTWIENKFKMILGAVDKVKNFKSNVVTSAKEKASKYWNKTKNLFGFGTKEKKETLQKPKILKSLTPVNNPNYKTPVKTSIVENKKVDITSSKIERSVLKLSTVETKKEITGVTPNKTILHDTFQKPKVNNSFLGDKKGPAKVLPLEQLSIPKVDIPSVSEVTAQTITEQKEAIQNNSSNNQQTVQNITQNIQVTAVDGKVDYEDLKEKFIRVQKELASEQIDTTFEDAS